MKTAITGTDLENNSNNRNTVLLRLLGAIALYLCFGLLADLVYALPRDTNPMDAIQGSVWLRSADGSYSNALLLQTEVDLNISGMIARAVVKQRFKNTSALWAEAIYVFPLPEHAAVDQFRLRVGGRLIEGQIQERQRARKHYESAKHEGKQAGLVEQQRANVFSTSVANIAPGADISVEIEFQQTIEYQDGRYRLRLPMVVGPRFHAANQPAPALDSDSDTDVSSETSPVPTNPVTLHIALDAALPLAELSSTYHAVDIQQTDGHRYNITLAAGQVFADRDFELLWRPELSAQPQTAVFDEHHDGYEYVLLSVLPPDLEAAGQNILPRDVIFILDVSGSMAGTSINQAKASLLQALTRLKPGERFNIIWFNDRAEQLYPRAMAANEETIQQARALIGTLDADGGTMMQPALSLALSKQPERSRLRQIIFLTDGNVDNERELFSLISRQLGDNRLFTIGIGSAPNSYFMRKAARAGRGTYTYIGDINEVQQKTDALLEKLEAPALVNIDINLDGTDVEILPTPVPDLYLGEPLNVLIRGKNIGSEVTLYGDYGETSWQQSVEISNRTEHPVVRIAWARAKIAFLHEQHHAAESADLRRSIRNEIIQTSIDHHQLSRFTSMVAVDVTPVNSSGQLYSEKLKTNQPHGWKPAHGVQMPTSPMLVAQLRLPQTASSASQHLMIAAMLFALAMVFYHWRKLL